MQGRGYKKYKLNELLYIITELNQNKSLEEVASALDRSKNGLRSKFSSRPLEDGKTSLRGIKQYKSLAELYDAFGEKLPTDPVSAKADVLNRIQNFRESLKSIKYE